VYLAKPFELQELGVIVRNLLERLQMIELEWRSRSVSSPTLTPEVSQDDAVMDVAITFTPREKEVLHLLASGLSNIQIGDRLHLSPRTVEKHVSSLLNKTDTSNRSELLRFAVDHHLV
jgi:DNA-binding NarL/FixJ family response regulator